MAASCGTDGWHIPGTLAAAKWPQVALRHVLQLAALLNNIASIIVSEGDC
jgi:hypothetical protein